MPLSEKLKNMVKNGIPHSLRPQIWLRVSGALEKKNKSETSYKDIVKASSNDHLMTSKQIEKVCFLPNSTYAYLFYTSFFYCLSMCAWPYRIARNELDINSCRHFSIGGVVQITLFCSLKKKFKSDFFAYFFRIC